MNRRIALLIVGLVIVLSGFATWVVRWEVSPSGLAASEGDSPSMSSMRRIDINTATARELERLPGMGPEVVERIVQHRPYRKLDELITRKVLGRKQFARIKDRIRIAPTSVRSESQ